MTVTVGIAGGGLIGRLLAWRVASLGAKVEIFDLEQKQKCCSHAAAGMLSPLAELATASTTVSKLGLQSLKLWQQWLTKLGSPQTVKTSGSLLVANNTDVSELDRVAKLISSKLTDSDKSFYLLSAKKLAKLEPDLAHIKKAYFLTTEGHVDVDAVLPLLYENTINKQQVTWHNNLEINKVTSHKLHTKKNQHQFDWACDCRGLGASKQLNLRSVRGEIIHVYAPEVKISRPIRLANRRYPVYVVPRENNHYVIGATEIESIATNNITVRSTLELLAAACNLHPGFTEAQIVETRVGLRPAFPDNEPVVSVKPGFVSINGLYRHGFLAGPALVEQAITDMGLIQ